MIDRLYHCNITKINNHNCLVSICIDGILAEYRKVASRSTCSNRKSEFLHFKVLITSMGALFLGTKFFFVKIESFMVQIS